MTSIHFIETEAPTHVACHDDGTFSYFHSPAGVFVANDVTVPDGVLASLPDDERNRVMRAMTGAMK